MSRAVSMGPGIITPEAVVLDVERAGVPSRVLAIGLDVLALGFLWFALAWAMLGMFGEMEGIAGAIVAVILSIGLYLAWFCGFETLMWVIVHSPFGKALQAIRDNEVRARFVGISVQRYRWIAFMISGAFTGLAGILWVPLNGLTTPDILYWPFSGEIVFMSVLGGFRTFTGPIVGAVVFNYLKTYAVASTEYWQLLLGLVLVILVMALPTGIVGTVARMTSKLRGRT